METISNTDLTLLTRLITGALYDFGGMLTTRDEPLTVSVKHNAAPMADLIREFLIKRGVPDCDDPYVKEWDQIFSLK